MYIRSLFNLYVCVYACRPRLIWDSLDMYAVFLDNKIFQPFKADNKLFGPLAVEVSPARPKEGSRIQSNQCCDVLDHNKIIFIVPIKPQHKIPSGTRSGLRGPLKALDSVCSFSVCRLKLLSLRLT